MKIRKYLIVPGILLLTLAMMVGCGNPGKKTGSQKDGVVTVATVQVVKGAL